MFPAGKYYVGDPCYVFSHDTNTGGDKLLDHTEYFQNDVYEFEGHPIWARSTAYGDGTYNDCQCRNYSVDAGLIGVVSLELFERDLAEIERLGHIIEFAKPFEPKCEDGIFTIGHIVIDTKGYDDSEEDDDDSYCYNCHHYYCTCDEDSEDD